MACFTKVRDLSVTGQSPDLEWGGAVPSLALVNLTRKISDE